MTSKFQSRSFKYKQDYAKIKLYVHMKCKLLKMIIFSGLTLWLSDCMITLGLISGSGWACFMNDKNDSVCNLDIGFRWSYYKVEGVSWSVTLAVMSLLLMFIIGIMHMISNINPSLGLKKRFLITRVVLTIIASYSVIFSVILYMSSIKKLYFSINPSFPNIREEYGFAFYVTIIGWMILCVSVSVEFLGVINVRCFKGWLDCYIDSYLRKHFEFMRKKYIEFKSRDLPMINVNDVMQKGNKTDKVNDEFEYFDPGYY